MQGFVDKKPKPSIKAIELICLLEPELSLDPPLYGDVDAHMLHYDAPTKIHMLKNKNSEDIKPLFDLAFSKRPEYLFGLITCH